MAGFESFGVRGGVWSGRLSAAECPGRVCAVLMGEVVAEARLTPEGEGAWGVALDLPGALISDGIVSLILVADDAAPGAPADPKSRHLGRLNLAAGRPLADDLLAELAELRAELELLKREFRRFAAGG